MYPASQTKYAVQPALSPAECVQLSQIDAGYAYAKWSTWCIEELLPSEQHYDVCKSCLANKSTQLQPSWALPKKDQATTGKPTRLLWQGGFFVSLYNRKNTKDQSWNANSQWRSKWLTDSPLFLHIQHHSTIQIYLLGRLSMDHGKNLTSSRGPFTLQIQQLIATLWKREREKERERGE